METTVLVVEDESIVALDISSRLSSLGFKVVGTARDSRTAIELAERYRPNLILMDIQIAGETDGIATAAIIGARFDIPSVFLTAFSDPQSLERAKQAHAYGYLLKPFQERELTIAIEMALFKHEAEREVRANRAILHATLNTIEEGVITTDREGVVIQINNAAEQLTGWRADAALGRALEEVLVTRKDPAGADEQSFPAVPNYLVHRDGRCTPVEISRTPVEEDGRQPGSCVVVFRDITSMLSYQRGLIDARNRAESAARAKSEFMARMSHEFRTPLNTILGMIRLALDAAERESVEEYLRISHDSARDMMLLVTDLLDYVSHDSGKVRLRDESFSLGELVHSVARGHEPEATRKGLRLAVTCATSLPTAVRGDPRRLRQILGNLLSNAIKFTPEGSVKIEVSAEESNAGVDATVVVEDTGVGIPREKYEEIFQEFVQLEDSRTRTAGGTGLGLAIARRLARAMNGDVLLDPRPDGGTIARCTVKLGSADPRAAIAHTDDRRDDQQHDQHHDQHHDPPEDLADAHDHPRKGKTDPFALHELREMLQNGDRSEAEHLIRKTREQRPDSEESETLFRVSLALRKKDLAAARRIVEESIRSHGR